MSSKLINAAQRILAKQGRYGDTELVHVNRREKDLLRRLGGAGTVNPLTGLKEFYEEGETRDRDTFEGVTSSDRQAGGGVGSSWNMPDVTGVFDNWDKWDRYDTSSIRDLGGTEPTGSIYDGGGGGAAVAAPEVNAAMFNPEALYNQPAALAPAAAYPDMLSPTSLMAAAPAPTAGLSAIANATTPLDAGLRTGAAVNPEDKPEAKVSSAVSSLFDDVTNGAKSIRDVIMDSLNTRQENLAKERAMDPRNGIKSEAIDFGRVPGKVEQATAASVPGFMGPAPQEQVLADEARAKDIRMGYAVPDQPAARAPAPAGPVYADVPVPSPRPSDEEIYGSTAPAPAAAASSTARGPGRSAPAAAPAAPGPTNNRNVDPLTRQEYSDLGRAAGTLVGNSADDDLAPPTGFPAHVPTPASRADLEKGIGINMRQRDERPVNEVLPDWWSKDMGTTPQTYWDPGSNGFRSVTTGDRVMDPSYAANAAGVVAGMIPGVGLVSTISGLLGGPTVSGVLANAQPGAPDFAAQTYGGAGEGGNEGAARAAQAALMASAPAAVPTVAAAAGAVDPFKNAIHDPLHTMWHRTPVR